MARTKQTARKRDVGAAQGQRRPSRMPRSAMDSVVEAAVAKREPYADDFPDPGSRLTTRFIKKKDRLLVKSLRLMDGQRVSLEGVEDMAKALDGLKTYINRAYAKEKWKDCGFDGHEINSISMKDDQLALVLDDERLDEYDPNTEPVFAVYSSDGNFRRECVVKTDRNGTNVDMGDFGSYQLGGASKNTYWTFTSGKDCADSSLVYHRS